jgi:hypothetical protein
LVAIEVWEIGVEVKTGKLGFTVFVVKYAFSGDGIGDIFGYFFDDWALFAWEGEGYGESLGCGIVHANSSLKLAPLWGVPGTPYLIPSQLFFTSPIPFNPLPHNHLPLPLNLCP